MTRSHRFTLSALAVLTPGLPGYLAYTLLVLKGDAPSGSLYSGYADQGFQGPCDVLKRTLDAQLSGV